MQLLVTAFNKLNDDYDDDDEISNFSIMAQNDA